LARLLTGGNSVIARQPPLPPLLPPTWPCHHITGTRDHHLYTRAAQDGPAWSLKAIQLPEYSCGCYQRARTRARTHARTHARTRARAHTKTSFHRLSSISFTPTPHRFLFLRGFPPALPTGATCTDPLALLRRSLSLIETCPPAAPSRYTPTPPVQASSTQLRSDVFLATRRPTQHPTPQTLHPRPYTPDPTPQTLHPRPYTLSLGPCPNPITFHAK
jgi:hypothetical protein